MNERFLPKLGVEQIGQIKIGAIRMEDFLEGTKLTFDLCDLLDTCDDNINTLLRTPLTFSHGAQK